MVAWTWWGGGVGAEVITILLHNHIADRGGLENTTSGVPLGKLLFVSLNPWVWGSALFPLPVRLGRWLCVAIFQLLRVDWEHPRVFHSQSNFHV